MTINFAALGLPLVALLAAGLVAGFAAGIFGIGGGFVVVPALVVVLPLLGGDKSTYTHVAVATSAATIIVTSIRSLRAHARRGAVEFQILKDWGPGLVIGSILGALLASHVNGRALSLIFAVGVALMSLNFLQRPRGPLLYGISGGLGIFSSLLGIGGGTIAIMVMTLCSRTIHRAIATASGMGTLIAVPSALSFLLFNLGEQGLPWGSLGFVNVPAALAVASMSILTAPLGVAAAHKLPPGPLKRIFGVYLLFTAYTMFRHAMKV